MHRLVLRLGQLGGITERDWIPSLRSFYKELVDLSCYVN